MKRRVLRFEKFLVFVFNMDEGDKKHLGHSEYSRGLKKHGSNTLNAITAFTKGAFTLIRPGRDPFPLSPGDGGFTFIESDTDVGHTLVATKDDSEYHCITPRDHTPKFWDRRVVTLKTGEGFQSSPGEYVYIAKGSVASISKPDFPKWIRHEAVDPPSHIPERLISTSEPEILMAEEDTILVVMSCEE